MKSSESGEFYIKNSVICTADTIISRYRSFGFFNKKKTILINNFGPKVSQAVKEFCLIKSLVLIYANGKLLDK